MLLLFFLMKKHFELIGLLIPTSLPLWSGINSSKLGFSSDLASLASLLLIAHCLGGAETTKKILIYLSLCVWGLGGARGNTEAKDSWLRAMTSCSEASESLFLAGQKIQMRQGPHFIQQSTSHHMF